METSLFSTNCRSFQKFPSGAYVTNKEIPVFCCALDWNSHFEEESFAGFMLSIKECSRPRHRLQVSSSLRSMDGIYDALAERLVLIAVAESNSNYKHIIGLCGPPGSGKSTLASQVASRVNKLWPQKSSCFDSQVESPEVAIVLPMDGFHLYRQELDAMEDPKEAHARRGSPWTFNPERLLRCLTSLRKEGSVYAPSFEHGVGDPVEDGIFVSLQFKVVIVEGKPPDVAKFRIDYNDRPNAELIMKSKEHADLIIKSVDLSR